MSTSWMSWVQRNVPETSLALTDPGPKHLPRSLLNRWRESLQELGAPEPAKRSLAAIDDDETLVVVTGQQPGVWGGPLYSLYKAATAVALARRLSTQTGKRVVPVYWVQGDDTDWGEVGWGAIPKRDLSLFRHRWNPPPIAPRHWVGSARISSPPEAAEHRVAWDVPARMTGELSTGKPFEVGTSFIRFLLVYFGEYGLLPIDSRWGEVRGGGRRLWRDYLERREDLARAVKVRGQEMEHEGRPVLLEGDTLSYGLFALDGEHRLPIDPERWETQISKRLERGEADRVAPSVLLRAVLQDHLFGTVAHVVGDAEATYLEQLQPVYDGLSVPAPPRPSRMRLTLTPRGFLERAGARELIENPDGWVSERARHETPEEAGRVLESLRRGVETDVEALRRSMPENPEIDQVAASALRKMNSQIGKLEEIVERRARRKLYREDPQLRALPEFLRPRRGDQERGLSGATLGFFLGEEAPEILLELAGRHLDLLAAGEAHHFALEGIRD